MFPCTVWRFAAIRWVAIGLVGSALAGARVAGDGPPVPATSPSGTAVYPAPPEEPLSQDFELTVDSQKVPVYLCRVSAMPFNQVWPGYQRPVEQTELASFAYWDMSAPVEVEVASRRPVESVAIRPTARGIQAKVEGNRIRFRMRGPQQITVEVNGWHKALHLFANAPEPPAPDPKAPGVRYFGPGVHRPGKILLESNQTIYLAGGAIVYGCIDGKDAENIRILGRGILDTSQFERKEAGGSICLLRCKHVTIDGLVLRDPNVWCLSTFACSDVAISNVKLIGLWRYNADGIDICNSQRVTVRNCFVRSFDDSLVVKGLRSFGEVPVRDVLFEGCVVWNDWGRALEIGAETCAPEVTDVAFRDCDIVRTAEIALDIQHGDRAAVKNVTFERIRLEVDDINHAPRIQRTREEAYPDNTDFRPSFLVLVILKTGYSQDQDRGTMENVIVRDCSVTSKTLPRSLLRGFDSLHGIRDVLISNLRINGRVVRSLEEAGITVGPHVENVRIEAP